MVENRRELLLQTAKRAELFAKKHKELGSSQKVIDFYEKEAAVCWREFYLSADGLMFWEGGKKSFAEDPFGGLCAGMARFMFWILRRFPKIVQNGIWRLMMLLHKLWDRLPMFKNYPRWDYLRWLAYLSCVWFVYEMYNMLVATSAWVGVAIVTEYFFAWLILLDEGARIDKVR